MKKLVVSLLIVVGLHCYINAKCIRKEHVKAQVDLAGKASKKYSCRVKAAELEFFQDNYCKQCGCHISDHDNL